MDFISKRVMHPTIPWWRGIRGRLLLFVIIIVALSLIILNMLSIQMLKSHFFRIGREINLDLAQKINEEVESAMDAIVRDLFSVSRIWPMEGESISDRHADLERLKDRNENIRLLSMYDIQGNKLLSVSRDDILPADNLTDRFQEGWVESSKKGGNIYISQVYPIIQTLPLVDISVPLKCGDQNQVRGFLTAVISLKGVYKNLEAIKLKRGQEIYIVDTNGSVVAYFSHLKGRETLGIKGLIPFWDNLGDMKNVKPYMSGIGKGDLIALPIYKNIRQQDVLGVISICPKLKWGIVVEETVNELLEPMVPIIRKNILISGLIFMFVSILSISFIGFILSPLIRLYRLTEDPAVGVERFDINKLKEVKEKLEPSEENLKKEKRFTAMLIDALDLLIIVLDPRGKVLICNKSCEKKIGYKQEEIIGKDWFELVYPHDARSDAIECFHKMVKGDAPDIIENYILTKEGDSLNIQWHSTTINDAAGIAEGVILAGDDITLKQKIQKDLEIKNLQLLKNVEDLENILSIVSHDLKNPLYIIQDFASILLQEYNESLSEDGLYYIKRIKANALNMEKLILDLLELSRVSRSKGVRQECPVSDLIQRALEEFRQVIRNKGIEVKISGNFPICFCEPERIFQVFMNLLSNSIKFMQDAENPTVEIGYIATPEEHEFFVKDNGIGIEKEYHDKIFVIFQRLQDVRDVEGTGVGLTIVKKIVETYGGRVWVESEKGKGATFYFTIPKKISDSEVYLKTDQTLVTGH